MPRSFPISSSISAVRRTWNRYTLLQVAPGNSLDIFNSRTVATIRSPLTPLEWARTTAAGHGRTRTTSPCPTASTRPSTLLVQAGLPCRVPVIWSQVSTTIPCPLPKPSKVSRSMCSGLRARSAEDYRHGYRPRPQLPETYGLIYRTLTTTIYLRTPLPSLDRPVPARQSRSGAGSTRSRRRVDRHHSRSISVYRQAIPLAMANSKFSIRSITDSHISRSPVHPHLDRSLRPHTVSR